MAKSTRHHAERTTRGLPDPRGLYDPTREKDACGVGFVANIKGRADHAIIRQGLTMLENMHHRGATGCEPNSGDGAGILTTLPDAFFSNVVPEACGQPLPSAGRYAVGMIFLPTDSEQRHACKVVLEKHITAQGQKLLGWRHVPTDNGLLGPMARRSEPVMEQVFIAAAEGLEQEAFERQLYVIRKQAYHEVKRLDLDQDAYYVCSLSSKVIVYKGQLTALQLPIYFPDLRDKRFASHLAMVHSRFSTNTFPSWDRAQPMRFMSHNGEINTLAGNVNWMTARQAVMKSDVFGDEFQKLQPIIDPVTSDSGMFDNVLELLLMAGRSLPHAAMMMIPEAWQQHDGMDPSRRAFYEYHSCLMEAWDGPASVAFTDGHYIGAVLDRNGLRPSRYYVTADDLVIMASEVGVLPVSPEKIIHKGRLEPGRMFLVDFDAGRIIDDAELKRDLAGRLPYKQWLAEQRILLDDLPLPMPEHRHRIGGKEASLIRRMRCLGYTLEDLDKILMPMGGAGDEAVGSMGNDAALACLSDHPRLVYDYFKQLFAQVTNPPIDPIREQLVMSLGCYIGPEGNLLKPEAGDAHRLWLDTPLLTNDALAKLKRMDHRSWRTKAVPMLFRHTDRDPGSKSTAGASMLAALDGLCEEATKAIDDGYTLLLLTDRGIDESHVAIPTLLAVGTVHQHLVRQGTRTRIGVIVESGEAREVHHHCLLLGYGADAINPYLAFDSLWLMHEHGTFGGDVVQDRLPENYVRACNKGIYKVMSKMGVSTVHSYKGAQIFEAIGLDSEVIDRSFCGTASRIKGVGFDRLAAEAQRRHAIGYPDGRVPQHLPVLPNPGQYQWRRHGEAHQVNPASIAALQAAARTDSRAAFESYTRMCNDDAAQRCALRGLMRLKSGEEVGATAVKIDEVEPVEDIVKRFCTGAMSLGALSPEAHESLAVAMNRIGGKSNTGEGGEDARRYTLDANGDSRRSAIKQVASARFGVTIEYLTHADQLQIKIAQGAKPGEGGQLPGDKVDDYIASLRHATPGVTLISPPPHHDIYSIEDLAQLIHDLKNANPSADISVKLVSEVGVGTVAAGVAKAKADHILISGHDGGTGASPLTSIKHAGSPWELGIAETHQTLVMNGLRSRVRVEVDGGMRTGRDVVIAALLGAEEFGFSTAPLITLGCIMMRKCHLNTCPVGVATQDPVLRKRFEGDPQHVINYLFMVAEQVREFLAEHGFTNLAQIVGHTNLLDMDCAVSHWKEVGFDFSPILMPAAENVEDAVLTCTEKQDHGLDAALDHRLMRAAEPALQQGAPVVFTTVIRNIHRTVGTMLSHEITKRCGREGLPDNTIRIRFEGSAGQSFAAWLAPGVTFYLYGDANDYTAKGLSGGRIVVQPPEAAVEAGFIAEENIIVGNVTLYGATSGEAYFRGRAGERFAVRNSGAVTVVEGVGDHGCEYMTNGCVVVLGPTGRNFAAGMSGGIAYVYDPDEHFASQCNDEMVGREPVEAPEDVAALRRMIARHQQLTGSTVAAALLERFNDAVRHFRKVVPHEYKAVLARRAVEAARNDPASRPDPDSVAVPG